MNDKTMIKIYANLVKNKVKKLEEVPYKIRSEVEDYIYLSYEKINPIN